MGKDSSVQERKPFIYFEDSQTRISFLQFVAKWKDCSKCEISKTAMRKVFCRGQLPCDILFVGEGPGATEDALGFPFVGRCGTKVLDPWIVMCHAYGAKVNITNTILCRPITEDQQNRPPTDFERDMCADRFIDFLKLARPKTIVLLGVIAQNWWRLLQSSGLVKEYPILDLYHPSFILRRGGPNSDIDKKTRSILRGFLEEKLWLSK